MRNKKVTSKRRQAMKMKNDSANFNLNLPPKKDKIEENNWHQKKPYSISFRLIPCTLMSDEYKWEKKLL